MNDLTLTNILKRIAYDTYEEAVKETYGQVDCPEETESRQFADNLKQFYEKELAVKQNIYESPLLSARRLFHAGQDLRDEIELIKAILTILNTNNND